jgi:two-component system sensor histidine kinase KdpD
VAGSGALTTYLGTAPGVGKTYTMLRAGQLRSDAGQRVVVGWVERHGRAETRAQIGDLEVVPPRPVAYGSGTFDEFDVEAVMASGASVVLVDELAHTVVGTTRRRWQDVADILAAGLTS